MQLTDLVRDVTTRFEKKQDLDIRMAFARMIADKYKFEQPELVLFFTHPELSTRTIAERCHMLGIVEEQYLMLAMQPGFRKFVKDYKATMMDTITTQSMDKVNSAVSKERFKFDKLGNATEDLTVETTLITATTPKEAPAQINVQVNNLWDRARQKARENILAPQDTAPLIESGSEDD